MDTLKLWLQAMRESNDEARVTNSIEEETNWRAEALYFAQLVQAESLARVAAAMERAYPDAAPSLEARVASLEQTAAPLERLRQLELDVDTLHAMLDMLTPEEPR